MRKPSPALVVATLALAVALTGTAGAAGLIDGHSIKNHSITANKLAKGAVTAPAVADHAIHKLALADGVIVNNTVIAPTGPKGDTGDQGPAIVGAPGAPGINGTAKSWAYVNSTGVISSDSGNVTLMHPGVGTWCVSAPGAVAVVTAANGFAPTFAWISNPSHLACAQGTFEVMTAIANGAATDLAFNFVAA